MSGDNSLSVEARVALSLALTKLPDPQFNLLVFSLNPPPGILPSNLAAQGDRVVVLLQWVENNGPGLAVLQQALAQITGTAIASPVPPAPPPTSQPTPTGSIFISYRRDDSASDTGRIYDRLAQEFGRDNVFKDVDSIPFGVDFAQHIDQEVSRCQVLLVVIGKAWLSDRLQNPDDFVRLEIESALKRGIPVVPVLLEGVTGPPPRDQLPESLQPLIRRNGTQVGHDPRFHADMGRLVKGLQDYFRQPSRPIEPPPPPPPVTSPVGSSQTVLGGSASQVNDSIGPVFAGPMTGNTININYTGTTAPAPTPTPPQPPPKPDPTYPRFSFEVVTVNPKGQIIDRREASAAYQTVDLGQGVTLEMVLVPEGTFMMGSPDREPKRENREGPQHQVTVAEFWMGKYPVTQSQYQAIMGSNPSRFKGDKRPVESVSWNDAVEFCDRLSKKLGQPSTLPSEAQWEDACRAGTTTPFHFGDTITPDLANYNGDYTYGSGPKGTYRKKTTEVGSFPPNSFGLYDMHGNVFEWCLDHWYDSYNGAPTDGTAWVTGGESNRSMVRGGSWGNDPRNCRCAYRLGNIPDYRLSYCCGFRVVSVPPRALG